MSLKRQPLPTRESAAGFREKYDLAVRRRSLFSARTTQIRYLETLRNVLDAWEEGDIRQDEAEEILRGKLGQLGYDPEAGGFPGDAGIPPAEPGTLRDLASHARIDLVLRTNQQLARNLARKAESAADPLATAEYPAWRLVRAGAPNQPRNWVPRWASAWEACGGEGAHRFEFVALKSSPIWAALGEVGDDSTGSDVPPFAYNSTMDWEDVEREECIRLGLIREDEEPAAPEFGGDEAFAGIDKALADLSDEDAAQLERELEAMARGEGIANEAALANANPYHCPRCGRFAGFDGHCAKCGRAPEGKVARERAAALLEKAARDAYAKPVRGIAWREGLGRIDLEIGTWGEYVPGRAGHRGEWQHGRGLSKIRGKHAADLDHLPDTLAFGRILRTRTGDSLDAPEDPDRRAIVHDGHVAFLARTGKNTWAITTHWKPKNDTVAMLEKIAETFKGSAKDRRQVQ